MENICISDMGYLFGKMSVLSSFEIDGSIYNYFFAEDCLTENTKAKMCADGSNDAQSYTHESFQLVDSSLF